MRKALLASLFRRQLFRPTSAFPIKPFSTASASAINDLNSISGFHEQNFSCRPIEELFPVIASLIEAKDLSRADQVISFCRTKRPQDWLRALNSPSIPNMIFKTALESFSSKRISHAELRDQFNIFRKDLNINTPRLKNSVINSVKPDAMAYALMCKYVFTVAPLEGLSDDSLRADLKILESEAALYDISIFAIFDVLQNFDLFPTDEFEKMRNYFDIESLLCFNDSSECSVKFEKNREEVQPQRTINFPEIRTISSKSEGINFIKNSLKQLFDLDSSALNNSEQMYNLQLKLEQDCYAAMVAKLRRESEALAQVTGAGNLSHIKKDLVRWLDELKSAIQNEFDGRSMLEASKNLPPIDSGYYLALLSTLDPEKISIIAIQELLKIGLYEPYFMPLGADENGNGAIPIKAARFVTLATNIGAALQREVFAAQISRKSFLNRAQLNPLQLAKMFDRKRTLDKSMRKVYARMEGDLEAQRDGWIPAWSNGLKAEIGSFLLALVESVLKHRLPDGKVEPIFKHCVIYSSNSRKLGVIRMIDEVFEKLKAEKSLAFVEAWAMPMLVPPKPWLTITSGGYLTHKNTCVRLKDDPVQLSMLSSSQKDGQLESVLMGLDVLGRVPWRINEPILKVAIELWNQGINVSEMSVSSSSSASANSNHHHPLDSDTNFPFMKRDDFERVEDYREYCRQAVNSRNEQSRQHSMTCDTNYKLEIARTFAGIPFYLPHSVDFRGRAYPIPPHLSHIGSDLSRGLLEFSEGRELGENGLFWLKVQFSNMCGNDKCSLKDREAFADKHLEVIKASARDPLAPNAFWRSADEPWQCLATCIEISEALDSPNPSNYISHLPVQQDGSCNGSQHYAALGGDVEGAEQVNLAPSPVPQDIYGTVAKIVSREIDRDCEKFSKMTTATDTNSNESKDDKEILAKVAALLKGKVTRKIVKQPVMTNIYGVTQYGAKKQIEARLKEFSLIPAEDEQLMRKAREYLTQKVFAALDELFVKARQIQSWLEYCATEICRSVPLPVAERYGFRYDSISEFVDDKSPLIGELRKKNAATWNPCKDYGLKNQLEMTDRYPQTSVTWTTPLAFRVLQPYLKTSSVQLRTVLQLCSMQQSSAFDSIDAAKQVAAFPPNFIHSLDATHMFRTALACFRQDITFASVHDCFWTHAATVSKMNRVLREEFVAMHGEPILERIRDEFLKLYRDYKVPVVLKKDSEKLKVWRNIYIPSLPERGEFDLKKVLESEYFFS